MFLPDPWLALAIGNSRLHWALFDRDELQQTWNTAYLSEQAIAYFAQSGLPLSGQSEFQAFPSLPRPSAALPLWLASVVPQQTLLWQDYPAIHPITLEQIPLQGLYPTLGIDRALALWGAVQILGFPALVIDAGTALTFTALDEKLQLFGGAILPGLSLQIRALVQGTAALPLPSLQDEEPPMRWATRTPDAIRSGVVFGLLATVRDFIGDWQRCFPGAAIALTGGDGPRLYQALQSSLPELAQRITLDSHLAFRGLPAIRYKTSQ
ncbi:MULTISPECIES: pantothenate kinase [unclassified Leptolyngbya]|uniref:pantothenate kinase n=1 Tax=unclassified Leptolyngbya TaxID=2650499 RepID=UPI001684F250|nr:MULTISPECIES: pantothenate kinase [unclassified Leptolyngbya]MBD1912232.1 pantothenate kinase [Leptolyngbya sp. FACHB-8]MBD2155123.1 pantothenate kinase [Leptolyngbya sp. FACHB-16]